MENMLRNKTWSGIILSFILLFFIVIPVKASDPLVVDDAGLLSNSEERKLEDRLEEISEKWNCDIVIVTVYSLDGKSPEAFADDYYDYHDYGYGRNYDGILFLLAMEDRDWAISTCGRAIKAFTDDGMDYIMDRVLPYLRNDNYSDAFFEFADQCDIFLEQADKGNPYDGNHMPKSASDIIKWIFYSVGIGFGISAIIVFGMKRQLNSVKMQTGAENYILRNSLNITNSRELFLYRTVNRVRKESQSSGGSGGHGSSVHRSSSGRSHGGSHGKF